MQNHFVLLRSYQNFLPVQRALFIGIGLGASDDAIHRRYKANMLDLIQILQDLAFWAGKRKSTELTTASERGLQKVASCGN